MNWKSKVAVILGAFFLCALGVSQAAYAAPPADNCALLTPAQIQKVLGQPFGAPSESKAMPTYGKQPWGSQCQYASQKGPNTKVTFIVYIEQSAAEAKQTFDRLTMYHYYTPKSKPAIGDSAYIDTGGGIHVLKGKVRYFIFLDSKNEKQLKDLATSVAGRI